MIVNVLAAACSAPNISHCVSNRVWVGRIDNDLAVLGDPSSTRHGRHNRWDPRNRRLLDQLAHKLRPDYRLVHKGCVESKLTSGVERRHDLDGHND